MARHRWLLLLLMLAVTAARGAQIYRWVDGNGQVHFSDQPHTGARPLHVRPDIVSGPTASRLDLRRRLLKAYAAEHARKEARAASARQREARRKRNCAMARERFEADRDARYLYNYDAAGKRHILNGRQRAASEAQARRAVQHWCR